MESEPRPPTAEPLPDALSGSAQIGAREAAPAARGVPREGHGWWPYIVPYFTFMLLISIAERLPEALSLYVRPVRTATTLGMLVYFYCRGAYPELRLYPFGLRGAALDFAVGLAGAALWMVPYLCIDSLRPDIPGFDPALWGASLVPLALLVRALGFGLATPFMEELLIRSWLLRYIDVFDTRADFRDVPIGRFRWRSFLVVIVWFTLSHAMWEWPVAVPWIVLTMLWFYYRKNLMSLVIAHAGSNLGILAFVATQSGRWLDSAGNPLSLWFFL